MAMLAASSSLIVPVPVPVLIRTSAVVADIAPKLAVKVSFNSRIASSIVVTVMSSVSPTVPAKVNVPVDSV